ncbi:hypothetical protein OAK97_00240 [bacterium]|nr:hypothetical protein [bacterium]
MIMDVSKEQAREWGAVIKSRTNSDAGIKVTLELNTQGKWEKFRMVELRMYKNGKHLASAALSVSHSTANRIATSFSVQPAMLNDCALWVYVADIPLGGSGYQFKMKDFVDLKEISKKTPQTRSPKVKQSDSAQPAAAAAPPAAEFRR